jgi:predicted secreted hydrolase
MKKIFFPRDGSAHNHIIEWWYFNGHLKGDDGKEYSFMDCLFRADAKRVKIPLFRIPLKTVYFSHSILSDIKNGRFYPKIDYVSVMSRQSFKRPFMFAEYISADPLDSLRGFVVNLIKESDPFDFRVKAESFDLRLKASKPPLLEGGDGFLNLHGRKTYYYSLTNLSASGQIYIGDKSINVSGKAWMDHQWANTPYNKDRWTWLSIQLDNNLEAVVIEYGEDKKDSLVDFSLPGGKTEHYRDAEIIMSPVGKAWKSKRTGASYELSWRIEIPAKKMIIEVEPLIKEQEMIFGALNYWEGPLKVRATINGRVVKGKGFLELVGRPSKYGAIGLLKDVYKTGIKGELKKIFPR